MAYQKTNWINNITPINANNLNKIENQLEKESQAGFIKMYAGSTVPDGYLFCDGSAISRETYSDLFEVIGTTYGTGDGSTTFNLPNLKGRVPVGLDENDTDFNNLGVVGGSKYLQRHTHIVNEGATTFSGTGNYAPSQISGDRSWQLLNIGEAGTGNSGNLQPYIVLNYIISY